MSKSHYEVIRRFRDGKEYKGHNVYARDGVLYSYGPHFPLAIKLPDGYFLLNGDKYSVSTSTHQRHTFSTFSEHPRVSLMACQAATTNRFWMHTSFRIKDFVRDDSDNLSDWTNGIPDSVVQEFLSNMPAGSTVSKMHDASGRVVSVSWHRIGQVLFTYDGTDYICGMDENSYFVCQLPDIVDTCADAFTALKPLQVRYADSMGIPVTRQGEWFFIPCDASVGMPPAHYKKDELKSFTLPREPNSAEHIVTRAVKNLRGEIFCYGRVRHSRRQHKVVQLNGWHIALQNTAVQSWSASGSVD